MYAPPIPDRAGKGACCELIDRLMHDVKRYEPNGSRPDRDALRSTLVRLDAARQKFHRLYAYTPKAVEETHLR